MKRMATVLGLVLVMLFALVGFHSAIGEMA